MQISERTGKKLGFCTLGFIVAGCISFFLESPYWLISVGFFLVAFLIPATAMIIEVADFADRAFRD